MKHKHHKHRLWSNKRFIALLVVIVVTVSLVSLAVAKLQSHDTYKPSYIQALNVKGSASDATYIDKVSSTYKFSVSYDRRKFKPLAYQLLEDMRHVRYSDKDALKERDYAMVEFFDNGSVLDKKITNYGYATADFVVSTNIHENFFDKRKAEYGQGLSNIELVEKHYQPENDEYFQVTKINTKNVKIAGYDYRFSTYIKKGHGSKHLPMTYVTELYQTVVDNKPYVIEITYRQETYNHGKTKEYIDSLRSLISNVNYGNKAKQNSSNKTSVAIKSAESVLKSDTNVPTTLRDNSALRVAARNQPATIRVGAIYCTDVSLLNANGTEYMRMDKACNPVVGSGSIISSNGHISTNGHVVRDTPYVAIIMGLADKLANGDRTSVDKYLTYLYSNGFMSKSQLEAMLTGVRNNDNQAISEFIYSAELIPRNRLKINSDNYSYAIQLSNEPIVLTKENGIYKFKFTKNVVEAKYIDSNFDPYSGSQGKHQLLESTSSDVAILKILKGDNFPVIQLGSIDNIKTGDLVTAIGFPAFVDGGLDTKKSKTFPSITQGEVKGVHFDSPEEVRKLIQTDTPIAGGNSGGPAINNSGLQVGLNTYGLPSCGDGECFSVESFFRDVADYKKLLAKNKISAGGSKLSEQWLSALSAFENGEYGDSKVKFQAAKAAYPQLYLADNFIVEADKVIKSQQAQRNLIILITVGLVILIISLFFIIKAYLHHKKNHVNYQQPPVNNPAGSAPLNNSGQTYPVPQAYPAQPQYPNAVNAQVPQPPQPVQQPGAPMPQTQPIAPYQTVPQTGVQGQVNVPGSTVQPSQANITPPNQPYANPQNPPQQ